MAEETRLTEEEYRDLEVFLRRTPRGRAFLDEHAERSRVVAADRVMSAIGELKDLWKAHEDATGTAQRVDVLRHELQDMSASIAQARREISAIRPKDGANDRIMTAANELDAIVMSTERASIEILGSAERILEASEGLKSSVSDPAAIDIIQNEVMGIFTACSFQDLTGQRTTKVVNALRYIEQRIMTLMELWGVDGQPSGGVLKPEPVDTRPDAHLLHGPSSDGIDQNLVDALLNGQAPPPSPAVEAKSNDSRPAPPQAPVAEEEVEPVKLDQSSIDDLFA